MKKSRRIIKIVLIVVGVLLVVFVVASFMLINHFMKEYFNRSEQKKYSEYMRWPEMMWARCRSLVPPDREEEVREMIGRGISFTDLMAFCRGLHTPS